MMKKAVLGHVIGVPVNGVGYTVEEKPERLGSAPRSPFLFPSPSDSFPQSKQKKIDSIVGWMNKFSKRADSFASAVREHVKTGPKISEIVMGKLSLGARILQKGGVEKVFTRIFKVGEREKLLKACQCYLSTSAGPIAGLLFISTEKIAFFSDRSLTFTISDGRLFRTRYKVSIPLKKIQRANPSENVNKPSQKYIQIVTVDNFEFWFMAFINYQKAFKYLQQAVSLSATNFPQ
ncbi:putative GEM-like protein 8 [Aristolochia californica]|uniref:putative GEM-like protein 8 n=1 Tax=Aristolochia californica TaxID=171875 RepID=UPI0035DC9973